MLKYILPGKLVQSIKNEQFSQFDQLIILLLVAVFKGGLGAASSLLGCPQTNSINSVLVIAMLIALVLAFVANGGRAGNSFAMKYVSLGSILTIWLYTLCWFGVHLTAEVAYNIFNLVDLTEFIFTNYWGIHSVVFSVFYLGAVWLYFSKFRSS